MKVAHQVVLYFVVVVILVLAGMGIMLNRVYAMNIAHQRFTQEWKELHLSINLLAQIDDLIRKTDQVPEAELASGPYQDRMISLVAVLEDIRKNSTGTEKFEERAHAMREEKEYIEIYQDFDAFLKTAQSFRLVGDAVAEGTLKGKIREELLDLRVSATRLQGIYLNSMGEASAYAERARVQILFRLIIVFVVFLVLIAFAAGWFVYLINKNTQAMVEQEKGMMIGLLAQSLAHEIRNPLGIIKSSTSVIKRKLPPDCEEYEIAGFLTEEVERIDQLIDELLQFNKGSRKDMVLKDPVMIIEQVRLLMGGVCEKKSLKIELADQAGGAKILCDSGRLKQALINVILNAVQASTPGGRIEVTAQASLRTYSISVRDYGTGFKKGALKKAFDPFFTTKENGLGLGLFIVKNIIDAHGGSIHIQPQLPQGTRVVLEFKLDGQA